MMSTKIRSIIFFLSAGLIGVLPFIFTFNNDELFEFPKMLVVYFFSVVIVAVWLTGMLASKYKKRLPLHWLDYALFIFVITQVLSTIFSINPYTSLLGYYSRFNGGLASTLAYFGLFFVWSRSLDRRQVKSLIYVLLASGFLSFLYAFPEHFGHSPSCVLSTGGTNWGVDCWIQDVQNRVFGTFGQPNWLAAYVVLIVPVGLSALLNLIIRAKSQAQAKIKSSLSVRNQGFSERFTVLTRNIHFWWLAIGLWLSLAVLVFTKSRSGFLALVVGLVIWAVGIVLMWWRQHLPRRQIIVFGLALTFVGLVTFGAFGTPFSGNLFDLIKQRQTLVAPTKTIQNLNQPETEALVFGGTDSGVIRRIVWQGAWKVFLRYPILGSGIETFAYSYYLDRPLAHNQVSEWDFLYNKAHNEVLNYLATTGLVGTGAYFLVLIMFGVSAAKYVISTQNKVGSNLQVFANSKLSEAKTSDLTNNEILENQLLILGMAAGVAALFVSNYFGFSTVPVNTVMYAFFAFLLVLSGFIKEQIPPQIDKKMDTISYIGTAIIGLSALLMVGKIVNYYRADLLYTQSKSYFAAGQYQASLDNILEATKLNSHEGLYFDELSSQVAQVAVALKNSGESTAAAQLASSAAASSEVALTLNNRHLNFYKTQAKVYALLSEFDPTYLEKAKDTLRQAMALAPTDPKLIYTLARIYDLQKDTTQAATLTQDAIALKPNYIDARNYLADLRTAQHDYAAAKSEYEYILTKISPNDEVVQKKLASVSAKLRNK